jgi:uncharacterized Zn finger protein
MSRRMLTERDLRRLVSPQVFQRGEAYWMMGAVRRLRRVGDRIEADVQGSVRYRTGLELIPPFEAFCDCPYDDVCKHVVAVGLTWLRGAQDETEEAPPADRPSLAERLRRLDADELRSLVVMLCDDLPEAKEETERWLLRRGLEELGRGTGSEEARLTEIRASVDAWLDPDRLAELLEEGRMDWTVEGQEALAELHRIGHDLRELIRMLEALPPTAGPFAVGALMLVLERLVRLGNLDEMEIPWWDVAESAATALAGRLVDCPDDAPPVLARLLDFYKAGNDFLEPVFLAGAQDNKSALALAEQLRRLERPQALFTALRLLLLRDLAAEAERLVEADLPDSSLASLLLAQYWRERASVRPEGAPTEEGKDHSQALRRSFQHYRRAAAGKGEVQREALRELAHLLEETGDLEEALNVRVQLFRLEPSRDGWRRLTDFAARLHRRAEVVDEQLRFLRSQERFRWDLCQILLEEWPKTPSLLPEAVGIVRELGQPELAVKVAERSVDLSDEGRPLVGDLLRWAAEALASRGGDLAYHQAARALRTLLRLEGDDAVPWLRTYLERHRRRRNLMRELARAHVLR